MIARIAELEQRQEINLQQIERYTAHRALGSVSDHQRVRMESNIQQLKNQQDTSVPQGSNEERQSEWLTEQKRRRRLESGLYPPCDPDSSRERKALTVAAKLVNIGLQKMQDAIDHVLHVHCMFNAGGIECRCQLRRRSS